MRAMILFTGALLGAFLLSCSKEHTDLPTGFKYSPLPPPEDFQVTAGVERASLTWSYPLGSRGALKVFYVYYVYPEYGEVEFVDTTSATSFVDSLLVPNLTYCYEVSAVDTTGFEGWRTAAKCVRVLGAD